MAAGCYVKKSKCTLKKSFLLQMSMTLYLPTDVNATAGQLITILSDNGDFKHTHFDRKMCGTLQHGWTPTGGHLSWTW